MYALIPLAALALSAGAPPSAAGVTVTGVEFLSERILGNGQAAVEATRRIPHVPGSCYRWVIKVAPGTRNVAIREVFALPEPALRWGGADGVPHSRTTVAPDRASAVTRLDETLEDGILTNSWCVAEGDPIGVYRIRVYAGARLLHRFDFRVQRETR
jgi:hypothetical protein